MPWIYTQSGLVEGQPPGLWVVGYMDDEDAFAAISLCPTEIQAMQRVHYLNGGCNEPSRLQLAAVMMQGMLANPNSNYKAPEVLTEKAYFLADALIAHGKEEE